MYAYAANNPVRFVDPDGRVLKVKGGLFFRLKVAIDLRKISPGSRINIFTGKIYIRENSNISGHEKGTDLLSNLIKSENTHIIRKTEDGNSAQSDNRNYQEGTGSGSYVNFNPRSKQGGRDSTGSRHRPTFVGLAHELGHSEAFDNGTQNFDRGTRQPGTIPPCESNSMRRENDVREENKQNLRPSYY